MGYLALVMENHMEKKMEHEIKTRFISGAYNNFHQYMGSIGCI